MLPKEFPAWETVYWYFRIWSRDGIIQKIHDTLREQVRIKSGRKVKASAGSIDSQSVKTAEEAKERGFDAGKKN